VGQGYPNKQAQTIRASCSDKKITVLRELCEGRETHTLLKGALVQPSSPLDGWDLTKENL